MVKWILFLSVLLGACQSVAADQTASTIEDEFQKFFGEPLRLILNDKEVNINVNEIEEDAATIPVKMQFKTRSVEKVLLLKLKNTGYTKTGYFNRACAEEPVFVSAYTIDISRDISELETRFRTHCLADTITLLLWARTSNRTYYSDSVTFKTTTESP